MSAWRNVDVARATSVVALLAANAVMTPAHAADDAADANGIVRFPPSRARTLLPRDYLRELEQRGCSIPQSVFESERKRPVDNVITGSFARRGQRDWAVLCSIDGVTHIDIHWGGKTRCSSTLDFVADVDTLAERAESEAPVGYGRGIDAASQKSMREYSDAFNTSVRAPDRTHQGIEDVGEKASVVWYCVKGTWVRLPGMD